MGLRAFIARTSRPRLRVSGSRGTTRPLARAGLRTPGGIPSGSRPVPLCTRGTRSSPARLPTIRAMTIFRARDRPYLARLCVLHEKWRAEIAERRQGAGHHWASWAARPPRRFPGGETEKRLGHGWGPTGARTATAPSRPRSGWSTQGGGFSWLDLYLMGLATPDEVPDMFVLHNLEQVGRRAGTGPLHGGEGDREHGNRSSPRWGRGTRRRSGRARCSTPDSCTSCCPGRSPTPSCYASTRATATGWWSTGAHVTGGAGPALDGVAGPLEVERGRADESKLPGRSPPLLIVGAGCGGGTDGTSVAPPTAPAPHTPDRAGAPRHRPAPETARRSEQPFGFSASGEGLRRVDLETRSRGGPMATTFQFQPGQDVRFRGRDHRPDGRPDLVPATAASRGKHCVPSGAIRVRERRRAGSRVTGPPMFRG